MCVFHCPSLHPGGRVVHSYGRLIPHEFPITDLQQISGPDGIGRITCTVSSGMARFIANGGQLETGEVSQTRKGSTSTLVVNPTNVANFQNRDLYCTNISTNFFYLFISSASKYKYHDMHSKQCTQPTNHQPCKCCYVFVMQDIEDIEDIKNRKKTTLN